MTSSDSSSKYRGLINHLREMRRTVIAFSGGVDSAFLAAAANEALGDNVLLITVVSAVLPDDERKAAQALSTALGCRHRFLQMDILSVPGFVDNPPDRCYLCKKAVFSEILSAAKADGAGMVLEGTTTDDLNDHRPGRQALIELGVRMPLLDTGFSKAEIRALSRERDLPSWDKPSSACLASRFPYGERLSQERLIRVARAEAALKDMGFCQYRVRSHGDMARVELAVKDLNQGWQNREKINAACREAGFIYAALDLKGYRTGSLNEGLDPGRRP